MSGHGTARVLVMKDFKRHQHYKNRRPPWIKLHNALLDDYAFLSLPDATRGQLMLLWLLASRHENRIPYDPKYIARALQTTSRIDFDALIASGLVSVADSIEGEKREHSASTPDASAGLAARKQEARVETETETETEGDSASASSLLATADVSPAPAPVTGQPALAVSNAGNGAKPARVLAPTDEEADVLEHYRVVHPKRKALGDKPIRLVRTALAMGYSVGDLKHAIDGNRDDPWHRERNKHELEYVFRDGGHIDQFVAVYADKNTPLSAAEARAEAMR